MQFQLAFPGRPSIFLPYTTHGRSYHILFSSPVKKEANLSVRDAEDFQELQTFFSIGEMRDDQDVVVGFIFYSNYPIMCYGSGILAYSRQWQKAVNERRFPLSPFGVSLLVRADHFYVYHRKNHVSFIVSPQLAANIKDNLEV